MALISLIHSPLFISVAKALTFWLTGLYLFGYVYFPIRFGAMDALLPSEIYGMVGLSIIYFAWCVHSLIKVIEILRSKNYVEK